MTRLNNHDKAYLAQAGRSKQNVTMVSVVDPDLFGSEFTSTKCIICYVKLNHISLQKISI
jgi:hypothetical protein